MSRYVARRRTGLGLDHVEVAVPQAHLPGAEAEVDFGEFHAMIAGVLVKCGCSCCGCRARAGRFMSRSPPRRRKRSWKGTCWRSSIRRGAGPDPLRQPQAAVTRVLKGRDRVEAERFIALRSHYGFDSFFCIPGRQGAHEKGGVEGEIGRFRRRTWSPSPSVGVAGRAEPADRRRRHRR